MNILKKSFIAGMITLSFSCVAEVSVVVNNANNDAIDDNLIKKIYLGKAKSFPNGNKVSVFTLDDSANESEEFRQKALSKSNSQFKSYWSKLAFTGKGTPPKEVSSTAEMIEAIKGDVNAIGFIESGAVTGDVKVVATF